MHCDFAFWVGGTRENIDDIPELERLPGAAGIKVFMGSSTGYLLVEDDAGARRDPRPRRAAAPPSIPRTSRMLRERKDLRVPGDPRSHPVWRDRGGAELHPTVSSTSPRRAARASMCCTSRPPRRWRSWRSTRTWRASR